MSFVSGERVKINPLTIKDVYEMTKWGKHESRLFEDYNFPELTDNEVKEWFHNKTSHRNNVCFSVANENNEIIGYINIKEIKKLRKSAKLGIVFDPNHLDKGYGTESILALLSYFFYQMNMKVMYLDVAKYNKRALRCYEKCGFTIIKEYKEPLFDLGLKDFGDDRFDDVRECFTINKSRIYCYCYKMEIKRCNYLQLLSTKS